MDLSLSADEIRYHAMTDCAQRLKVLHCTLASSFVNWVNMIDLPELAFCRILNHFIELKYTKILQLKPFTVYNRGVKIHCDNILQYSMSKICIVELSFFFFDLASCLILLAWLPTLALCSSFAGLENRLKDYVFP